MKPKDIVILVIALAFIVGVGYVAFSQFGPHSSAVTKTAANQVETVTPIASQLDANDTLAKMDSTYQVRDYKVPVDLTTGLGNNAPFGN